MRSCNPSLLRHLCTYSLKLLHFAPAFPTCIPLKNVKAKGKVNPTITITTTTNCIEIITGNLILLNTSSGFILVQWLFSGQGMAEHECVAELQRNEWIWHVKQHYSLCSVILSLLPECTEVRLILNLWYFWRKTTLGWTILPGKERLQMATWCGMGRECLISVLVPSCFYALWLFFN